MKARGMQIKNARPVFENFAAGLKLACHGLVRLP